MNEKWVKSASRKGSYPQLSPEDRDRVIAVIKASAYPHAYTTEQKREILAAGGPIIDRL